MPTDMIKRYSDSCDAEVTHFSLTDNLALFYYESEWAWMKQNQYQLSANEDTKMWKFGNRQCSHKPENTQELQVSVNKVSVV